MTDIKVMTNFVIRLLAYCSFTIEASRTNFKVTRFELCNKTQGLVRYIGNITTEGNNQFLTSDLVLPFPLGDNIGVVCRIESKTIRNIYAELYVIREKNFCRAVHHFLGEFWYDIERASQIPPGRCPIQAGRHHVHHVLLNFNKMSLQTFPFGSIRFTIKLVDNRSNDANVGCWLIEVDNVLN